MTPALWAYVYTLMSGVGLLVAAFFVSLVPRRTWRRAAWWLADLAGDVWSVRPGAPRGSHAGRPVEKVLPPDDPTVVLPVIPALAPAAQPPVDLTAELPVAHTGADADWSPKDTYAAAGEPPAPRAAELVLRPALDREALDLQAAFDQLVADARHLDAEWLEFQARVDEGLTAAGLDVEPHRRWRESAMVFDTAEYQQFIEGSGQLVAS